MEDLLRMMVPVAHPSPARRYAIAFALFFATALAGTVGGCSGGVQPNARIPDALTGVIIQDAAAPKTDAASNRFVSVDDELWIIETPPATPNPLTPGTGAMARIAGSTLTPFPLASTEVQADIEGCIASVDVKQHFANPSSSAAEVAYAFPLPAGGLVSEFVMSVGRRHIRGIVRERAEAEQFYKEALHQGLRASLLVQQGPNLFVQRVANLQPGAAIDVNLRYFQTVPCRAGWFEFSFPAVVGVPGNTPPFRDGHELAVAIHINPGFPIETAESRTHSMTIHRPTANIVDATLNPADQIPNTDLIFRYKLAGDTFKTSFTTEPDGTDGGVFSLLLVPPTDTTPPPANALEILLTLSPDSGPLGNETAVQILRSLTPAETFQILYANPGHPRTLSPTPLPATPENIDRAIDALSTLNSLGCSGMDVLKQALDFPATRPRQRIVCHITNGQDLSPASVAKIATSLGDARILAIAPSPHADRPALGALARTGRGFAIYFSHEGDHRKLMAELFASLRCPTATDIHLDFTGIPASDQFPATPRDLFPGNALYLIGRYHGPAPAACTLHAIVHGQPQTWTLAANVGPTSPGRSPLACLWVSRKIASLLQADLATTPPGMDKKVLDLSLEYGVVSPYTSFITVDAITGQIKAQEATQTWK